MRRSWHGCAAVSTACRSELAAARVGLLTVPELAARLRDGLDAIGPGPRDAPARQRTLKATLEWSYALLTHDERAALIGLSVFAGGCTLDAAQAVTGAPLEVLEALVEKNLVVHRALPNGRSRITLLETVGGFARDRLGDQGEPDAVGRRHLDYYLAVAERAAAELERADPPALVAELDAEIHNIRAALAWTLDRKAAVPALRLATALEHYWPRGQLEREGARWLRAALALPDHDVPTAVRAAALAAYACCLAAPDTIEQAEAAARESLELARSIGDVALCAHSTQAFAEAALGVHRVEDSYRYAAEAERLALEADDEPKRNAARHIMATMAPTLDEALALGEQLVAAYRRSGSDRRLAEIQSNLTYTALYHRDLAAARRLADAALHAADEFGDPLVISFARGNDGVVALLAGDVARAADSFTLELRLADRYRYHRMLYEAINGLAGVAAMRGDDELAARLSGAAEITAPDRHDPVIAKQLDDRCFAPVRARLGERAWRTAHAAGAALTARQAVDLALSPANGGN
jgi:hypothetical protein